MINYYTCKFWFILRVIGEADYIYIYMEVISDRTKAIHDSIKKNSLALFSSLKRKVKSKFSQKMQLKGITPVFMVVCTLPISIIL